MSRRAKKSNLAFAMLLLIVVATGGALKLRWDARQAAIGYGLEAQAAIFEQQAPGADGQPRKPADVFGTERMQAFEQRLRSRWNIMGPDYLERAEDLRTGVTYLQSQLAEAGSLRFAHPPKLRHFTVDPGDKGNAAIQRATRTLLEDYLGAVGSR